jgi:hypothetical protein
MSLNTTPEYLSVSSHGIAEVRERISNHQYALFALRSFQVGALIADFWPGAISTQPTYLTVQVGRAKHITLQPAFLQYINHSCDPNVFFDTGSMKLLALKDLEAGDELCFFYPSTEWKMRQPFQCYCGSPQCLGKIRGAAFLPEELWTKYRLTDFIQQQLAKKSSRKVA